jgi:hypothetical protein
MYVYSCWVFSCVELELGLSKMLWILAGFGCATHSFTVFFLKDSQLVCEGATHSTLSLVRSVWFCSSCRLSTLFVAHSRRVAQRVSWVVQYVHTS